MNEFFFVLGIDQSLVHQFVKELNLHLEKASDTHGAEMSRNLRELTSKYDYPETCLLQKLPTFITIDYINQRFEFDISHFQEQFQSPGKRLKLASKNKEM